MSIHIPLGGDQQFLTTLVNNWGTLTMHLFDQAHAPADADTAASYHEASFPGYAPVALSGWSAPASDGAGRYQTTAGAALFTLSVAGGPYSIYGYYVTNPGGNLLWSEQFSPSAEVLQNANQQLTITPTFTFKSEY